MKITVITAVYNRVDDLEKTMQSVLQLSRPGLDYIVIDGGSTDGTVEVILKYADKLKHWLSEPDKSVYHAMNKGWALAEPDSRVIFVGAGDRLFALPEAREGDSDTLEIFFGNVQLDQNRVFHARAGIMLRLFNTLHHQALLIPKRLHPDPPFDMSYPLYSDFDFNQRLYRQGAVFRFSPDLTAYAAPGGLTDEMTLDELQKIIRKNYGPFWSALSSAGFTLAKYFPFLGRCQPIK
jgi:glycosyltransferase involved in cell wall biosynthesis